jgi:hypothetical protein
MQLAQSLRRLPVIIPLGRSFAPDVGRAKEQPMNVANLQLEGLLMAVA